MERDQLKKVFTKRYSRDAWKGVIENLFPGSRIYLHSNPIEDQTSAQKQLTEHIEDIGRIRLSDESEITITEIKLKSTAGIRIQRNRVTLRNLVTSLIIPGFTDAGLFVFYDDHNPAWRFSFLSKSLEWDETGKMVRQITHPKRFTYVFGPGETVRTALDRFLALKEKLTRSKRDLLRAFSVEKINDEFFDGFNRKYRDLYRHLYDLKNFKKVFRDGENADDKEKLARDFAKKTLGRILFIYFLQKKRWMGASNSDYQDGDPEFFQNYFETAPDPDDFYAQRLVPLFFEALNEERKGDIFKATGNCIPYLNGSLFHNDRPEANQIRIPAQLWTDLVAFLGRYNFTVDESSPDDTDVGIDPEMLGKIFENLLEENRHRKGTFYTPKSVVQYMCQETLLAYLQQEVGTLDGLEELVREGNPYRKDDSAPNQISVPLKPHASAIAEALQNVRICDPAIGSGAFPIGMLQEIFKIRTALNWELDPADTKREIIRKNLYGVDIDKGAVDIARLRFYLSLVLEEERPQALPNLDYRIMQGDSLFESFKHTPLLLDPPAPKEPAVQLLFADPAKKGILETAKKQLQKKMEEFFSTGKPGKKESLRKEIDQIVAKAIEKALVQEYDRNKKEWDKAEPNFKAKVERSEKDGKRLTRLSSTEKKWLSNRKNFQEAEAAQQEIKKYFNKEEKPYFLWHLYFRDIFEGPKGGFDIVIGNPPYIRQEELKRKGIKPFLEKFYPETFNSTADIYTYFFVRGQQILKPNGLLAYICSKQYTRANFGRKIRKYLGEKIRLRNYLDFDQVKIFEATVDTSVIIMENQPPGPEGYSFSFTKVQNHNLERDQPLVEYEEEHGDVISSEFLTEERWSFVGPRIAGVLRAIEGENMCLKNSHIIRRGLITGLNEAFLISTEEKLEMLKSIQDADERDRTEKVLKPFLRGRNVKKWHIEFQGQWLINSHNGYGKTLTSGQDRETPRVDVPAKFPTIFTHLKAFQNELMERRDQGNHWTNLRNCAYLDEFQLPKVIWKELSDKPSFSVDYKGYLSSNTTYFIPGSDASFLCSVLNSKVVEWYFNHISTHSGVGTNRWFSSYVERIPIAPPHKILEQLGLILRTIAPPSTPRISEIAPNELLLAYFERVLNGCVYELYFGEHMRERNLDIIHLVEPHLENIEGLTEAMQYKAIARMYDKLSATDSGIRERMDRFESDSPDLLAIIERGEH